MTKSQNFPDSFHHESEAENRVHPTTKPQNSGAFFFVTIIQSEILSFSSYRNSTWIHKNMMKKFGIHHKQQKRMRKKVEKNISCIRMTSFIHDDTR